MKPELRHYLRMPSRETLCGKPGDVTIFASKTTCERCRALFAEKGIVPDVIKTTRADGTR